MSIYGDMLLFFPEQRRSLNVYAMTPKINGGWDIVPNSQQTITGIYQNTSGDQTVEQNGNLVHRKGLELWTEVGGLSDFFTSYEGDIYRLTADNQWKSEGGFYRYTLNKVVGNNGTESDIATWNLGGHTFS